jgi:methionine aminopeptidase
LILPSLKTAITAIPAACFCWQPSILSKRLNQITYECMWLGISKIKPGAYLGDIGM